MAGHQLGIDFGTSNTVAVLHRADGVAMPLLFDSSPLLASGVFAAADGTLRTGADAERAAAAHPGGFEANPKRRIDDGIVWLGERELPVGDAVAAVLARVAADARRTVGEDLASVVLTHPVAWSRTRLGLLADAAGAAGLGAVRFVPEPVAAAAYFAGVLGGRLPLGDHLVVYDLGAGTFDVSVVRRTDAGFDVVAADGLPDVGGLDLDAAVVAHARTLTAAAADAWSRLDWPQTPADQRDRRALWLGARAAKEQLSRHSSADLHVPLVDTVLHITRDEFDTLARPCLEPTVALTLATLRSAGLPAERIAGVFLVGGSSRIPLAGSLLHRALRIAPTAIDQPELVVAWGSLSSPTSAGPARSTASPPSPAIPVPLSPPLPAHVSPVHPDVAAASIPAAAAPVSPLPAVAPPVAAADPVQPSVPRPPAPIRTAFVLLWIAAGLTWAASILVTVAGLGTATGVVEVLLTIVLAILLAVAGAFCGRAAVRLRHADGAARRTMYVLAVVLLPLWPAAAAVIAAAVAVNRPAAKAWLHPHSWHRS